MGKREPNVYGNQSFENFFSDLQKKYPNLELKYLQSNVEGVIIDYLQQESDKDGIILNAAGYTHTSVSIADAVKAIEIPVIEVHISNIFAREEFRHTSLIAPYCKGSIIGFGLRGYELAIDALR